MELTNAQKLAILRDEALQYEALLFRLGVRYKVQERLANVKGMETVQGEMEQTQAGKGIIEEQIEALTAQAT